jgi:uncharacterized protein YdaU (DUF1376 family)
MHYYQHHIGDFIKATARLTDGQSMAYLRLLWMYYDTEKPLKTDIKVLAFQIGATIEETELLLDSFFWLSENGWHHTRCDQEIADYRAFLEKKSNAGRASAERRKNNSSTGDEQVFNSSSTDVQLTNNHKPLTINQETINTETTSLVVSPSEKTPSAPIAEIVDLYNSRLPMLPRVTVVSDSRKRLVAARWRDVVSADKLDRKKGLEFFEWFFVHVGKSKFLTGKSKDWKANFEFLFTASKFPRIVEGAYHQEQT